MKLLAFVCRNGENYKWNMPGVYHISTAGVVPTNVPKSKAGKSKEPRGNKHKVFHYCDRCQSSTLAVPLIYRLAGPNY